MWEIDRTRVSGLIDGLDRYPISRSQIMWSRVVALAKFCELKLADCGIGDRGRLC